MNFENIMLSEKSQEERQQHIAWFHLSKMPGIYNSKGREQTSGCQGLRVGENEE